MQPNKKTTIDTKDVFYIGNGTGRDTYILKNNGGFTKPLHSSRSKDKFDRYYSFNFSNKS